LFSEQKFFTANIQNSPEPGMSHSNHQTSRRRGRPIKKGDRHKCPKQKGTNNNRQQETQPLPSNQLDVSTFSQTRTPPPDSPSTTTKR